jgi:hypothetical protein
MRGRRSRSARQQLLEFASCCHGFLVVVARCSAILLLSVVGIAAIGCGDGRPARMQVSGQVLIDSKPLNYGFIRFVPKGGRPAGGRLDDQGRFTLSSYGSNDGIITGIHRVEVDGSETISSTQKKWHAPKKYFRYKTSGLEQEITGPTDSLVINLTWDGGKPFVERVR